ncbi:hypothetical protein WJX73_000166 [Symbiochloris irregularis]|uniref:Uncharacterized protein n=1 Tax=Symbiochloris irregularis TaxID=706552 RepID=A0AAW1PLX5_9CHLO
MSTPEKSRSGLWGKILGGKKDDPPKATKAHMGKKNEFIYDEKLKMWREKGKEINPADIPPAAPPVSRMASSASLTTAEAGGQKRPASAASIDSTGTSPVKPSRGLGDGDDFWGQSAGTGLEAEEPVAQPAAESAFPDNADESSQVPFTTVNEETYPATAAGDSSQPVQTYGGGYTWDSLLEWANYYQSDPQYLWTAEQAQEWLNTMQPDPLVAPTAEATQADAHHSSSHAEGTYPQIDVSAAEGTYDVSTAEGTHANDDVTPAAEAYPQILHASPSQGAPDEAGTQHYGVEALAESASGASAAQTTFRSPSWRLENKSVKLTGLPWDEDSDDDTPKGSARSKANPATALLDRMRHNMDAKEAKAKALWRMAFCTLLGDLKSRRGLAGFMDSTNASDSVPSTPEVAEAAVNLQGGAPRMSSAEAVRQPLVSAPTEALLAGGPDMLRQATSSGIPTSQDQVDLAVEAAMEAELEPQPSDAANQSWAALRELLEGANARAEALHEEKTALEGAAQDAIISHLEAELAVFQTQVQDLRSKADQVADLQLKSSEGEEAAQKLGAEVERLTAQLAESHARLELAASSTAAPESSVAPQELQQLQAQLAQLQGELADARAENDDMMTDSLEKDEEIERLLGQLSRATRGSQSQEGGDLSSQLAEAKTVLQAAQVQVTELTQQLQEAERRGHESSAAAESSGRQLAASSAQLAESQQQVGSLQAQLQELQEAISSERESFSTERQSFTAELAGQSQLQEQLRQEGAITEKVLEERAALLDRAQGLEAEIQGLREASGQHQAAAEQLATLRQEKEAQTAQMRKLRSKAVSQAKAMEKTTAEVTQLREQEGKLHEEVAQLQAALLQRDVQIKDLQQNEGKIAALQAEVAEGQAQLAVLQQDAVQMKEQQRLDFNRLCQLDELNTQLQMAAAEKAELRELREASAAQEAALHQQIQALQARHTQEVEALQSEVQQLAESRRTTEQHFQAELESAQGEAAARVEELVARIETLENDNYDVITCITQEADKTEALQQLLVKHGVPFTEIEAVISEVEETHAYSGDAPEEELEEGTHISNEGQDSSADPGPSQTPTHDALVHSEAHSPAWGAKSHAPDAQQGDVVHLPGAHQGDLGAESAGAALGEMGEFDGWDSDNNWGA